MEHTLFGHRVRAGSSVFGLLPEGDHHRNPTIRIDESASEPTVSRDQLTEGPLGEFLSPHPDRVIVRSPTSLWGSVERGQGELRIDYHLPHQSRTPPADVVAAVAVDEFAPLGMDLLGHICLHAAIVVGPDRAGYVLLGDSGTGKSTSTALAGLEPGWSVASDDAVLLEVVDDRVVATASYPGIRLRKESADLLAGMGHNVPYDKLPLARSTFKRRILPDETFGLPISFHHGPVDVAAIVDLRPSKDPTPTRIETVPPVMMVSRLVWSAFAIPTVGRDREIERFDQCADIAGRVASLRAEYHKTPTAIPELLTRLVA